MATTLLEGGITKEKVQTKKLMGQAESLTNALKEVSDKLDAIPDEAAVADYVRARDEARERLLSCDKELVAVDARMAELAKQEETLSSRLDSLLRSSGEAELENAATQRFLKHSGEVRLTLDRFRVALIDRHVSRLAELILKGFEALLRKKSLVSGLKIDATSCALKLLDNDGREVAPERLSAAERQLLAVSMLWGLGRASGRPLPVVVDTPLGRLDGSHRDHLVTRYFPYASHQVLLLSTDEEIDEAYYHKLKPWIGRAYRLEYDESSKSSSIKPGYLWE